MGKVSGNWITGMHSGRASSPCWYLDASAGRNRFLGVDSHRPVAGALHHTPRHPRLQRIDSQYWDEEMMVILSSCQIVKLSNCQIKSVLFCRYIELEWGGNASSVSAFCGGVHA